MRVESGKVPVACKHVTTSFVQTFRNVEPQLSVTAAALYNITVEIDLHQPFFQLAKPEETMREYALALAAVKDDKFYPSGTAVIIGERLAITAKHLFDDDWNKNLCEFSVVASQVRDGGNVGALWYVERVFPAPHSDIVILFLTPVSGSQSAVDYEWKNAPILNPRPPPVGEAIWGFGYPGSEAKSTKESNILSVAWSDQPSITTGEVIEVHDLCRETFLYRYPCFRTNARFDGGMSGGPVFNSRGELCGLIWGGLPPEGEGLDHASYVSTLWPFMGTMMNLRLKGFPAGYYYPLRKLAQLGLINVLNLDQIRVEFDSHNVEWPRVGLRK